MASTTPDMHMPPGAQGVTWQLTGGVVKNIIPAIASTNAIVAAACALEALKLVTMCSTGINNYMLCAHPFS
jgi:ubiquitin-activating enzyme E1 C